MMHGLVLARAQRFRQEIARFGEQAEIIEFPFLDVGHVAFTNLSHTERLIEAGEEKGVEFLEGPSKPAGGKGYRSGRPGPSY